MALVPVNLTGGSYTHKSLPLSAQVTRNFWPQKQDNDKTMSSYALISYPGYSLFGTQAGGIDRGMFEHQGILYKVTGTTLYTVSSTGVHTSCGTIAGSGRCIFAPIGTYIVISTGGVRYLWNGSSIATISDVDLETGNSVAHLNNQIIYDGLAGRFFVSDVGDATAINALNYATAESDADNLQRVYAFNSILYLMGTKTIELWYNSGNGNPPFDRYEGGTINVGLGAIYSVANDDDSIYFYGDDDQVYVMRGGVSASLTPITNLALSDEFREYGTVSDAIGWMTNFDGQWQYHLTFPTANKTWVYNVGGEWFELSSGAEGGRALSNSYAFCFRKHLVADYQNGNIYVLDDDVYTENGATIIRTRDSAPIHGGLLNAPSKNLWMNRFELLMETGVGILSGQGSDPVVMLSFSDDGGRTFSNELWGKIGKLGQFQWRVEWFSLGQFKNRIIRIRVSDPVAVAIFSAAAEIEVGV